MHDQNDSYQIISSKNGILKTSIKFILLALLFTILGAGNSLEAAGQQPIIGSTPGLEPEQEGEDDPLPGDSEEEPPQSEDELPPTEAEPAPAEEDQAPAEEAAPAPSEEESSPAPEESDIAPEPEAAPSESSESEADNEPAADETTEEPSEEAPAPVEEEPAASEEAPAPAEAEPVIPEEESAPEPEAAPISIEAITLSPEPTLFLPVENFEALTNFVSAVWQTVSNESISSSEIGYSDRFTTQGIQSLAITAPINAIPSDEPTTLNTVQWSRPLFQPVDWNAVELVTIDLYVQERLSNMPTIALVLTNAAGESFAIEHVERRPLHQWENHQVTFVLSEVPASITSDIASVGFRLSEYNDGLYGDPLEQLNVYIDNMRLDGGELWDGFEAPAFELQAGLSNVTSVGQTQSISFDSTPGAMYMTWNQETEIPSANAGVSSATPRDWSGYRYIRGKIYTESPNIPINLSLNDGLANISTATAIIPNPNQWNDVIWPIPQIDGFNLANITGIEVAVNNLSENPSGTLFIDQLELGRTINVPYGVSVDSNPERHLISWQNPLDGRSQRAVVRVAVNDFPLEADQGVVVCEVPIIEVTGSCELNDIDATQTYYYSVSAVDESGNQLSEAYGRAISTPVLYQIGNGPSLGFDQQDGSLDAIKFNADTESQALESSTPLWHIDFIDSGDENALVTLHANQFDPESESNRFEINRDQGDLIYRFDQDGKLLEVILSPREINGQGFDFSISVNNQTGQTIRKVTLPALEFPKEGLERALVPAFEGIALLPSFFEENRQTSWGRPDLFADLLAVESSTGNMGLIVVQNEVEGVVTYQPSRFNIASGADHGAVTVDFLTSVASDQTWNSPTLKLFLDRSTNDLLNAYISQNSLDQTPTLLAKSQEIGPFDAISASPIVNLDFVTLADQGLPTDGTAWRAIQQNLINFLPQPAMVQYSNWQEAANQDELANLPAAQPINFEALGSVDDMRALLDTANTTGRLSMPVIDLTIWNERNAETGELPALDELTAVARSSRQSVPLTEAGGYIVKPWHPDVQARNDVILDQYSSEYPQEFLFVDMAGLNDASILYSDDDREGALSTFYMQGLAEELDRVGARKSLILNGMSDQMSASALGFSGSLQEATNQLALRHLGGEFANWTGYPLAARLLHTHVAFYPNAFDGTALPTDSSELFSYYTLNGYNLATDTEIMTVDQAFWLNTMEVFQSHVNSRTFGQPLNDVRLLTEDRTVVETVWSAGLDELAITANFDPAQTGEGFLVDGYEIAPNGFMARSARGDLVAGIFSGLYNGISLSEGPHWLVADYQPQMITVYQPQGGSTQLAVNRPAYWRVDSQIRIEQVLSDGRAIPVEPSEITGNQILFEYQVETNEVETDRVVITYGQPKDDGYRLLTQDELEAFLGTAEEVDEVVEEAPVGEAPVEEVEVAPVVTTPEQAAEAPVVGAPVTAEVVDLPVREPAEEPSQFGFSELFEPLDNSWLPEGVAIEAPEFGRLRITENNPESDRGILRSAPVTINLDDTPFLRVNIPTLSEGGNYLVSVKQLVGNGDSFIVLTSDEPNAFLLDIPAVTGLNGEQTLEIEVDVIGEGALIEIDTIQITD